MGICGSKQTRDAHTTSQTAPLSVEAPPSSAEAHRRQLQQKSQTSNWGSESDGSEDFDPRPSRLADVATESSRRRRSLIRDKWADIKDFYDLDEKRLLGKGAYGNVCKATCKETRAVRAVKCLSKARARETRKRYRQEVAIMKMFDHPNIIRLFETFEDKKHIFLVLELCTGGDLLEYLVESGGRLDETRAALVMDQILRPVLYMHEKRAVCHRDIKPENFLFLKQAPVESNTLKVIDFGFACTMEKGEAMTTKLGTMSYLSPQVLVGQYDESCDLWSCGVIMYVLLSGQYPFQGKCDAEVIQSVRKGNYAFKGPMWDGASESSKDLIRKLLKYDPQERYTAEQALAHEWVRLRVPKMASSAPLPPTLLLDLRCFCAQSRFRRGALVLVAQHLSEDDTRALRNAFTALDSRGVGVLNVEELQECLRKKEVQDEYPELLEVMDELAAGHGDCVIGFSDFLAASLDARHLRQESACRAAFRAFDRNGDGRISLEELAEALTGGGGASSPRRGHAEPQASTPERSRAVALQLQQADTNGDGVIDFKEFMEMLRGDVPPSPTSSSL